ncbi:MAG: sterol desaturase family protein [Chitinophagales bacterium]|nr:sterol desaturase family protein [Chitinophagales bacterium]MCZ2394314.1 sterol desaturase family protein [Chitinophagales bacterium]
MKSIDLKESASSIGMGLIAVIVDIGVKAVVIGFFIWLYQYRIFDNLGTSSIENFFNIDWHIQHWWVWALCFLGDDFTFYWHHRLSHEIRLLWAAHVNHHSSVEFNFSTALRQSPTEYMYQKIWWIWMPLIGFHPFMILICSQISLIYQFFLHTEVVKTLGIFESVFNTPSHHRVHHGSDLEYLDKNYGGILIIWDKLLGTYQKEYFSPKYGITTNINSYNLFKISFHEFIDLMKDVKNAKTWKHKIGFLFHSPGWNPYGEDLRVKIIKKITSFKK